MHGGHYSVQNSKYIHMYNKIPSKEKLSLKYQLVPMMIDIEFGELHYSQLKAHL